MASLAGASDESIQLGEITLRILREIFQFDGSLGSEPAEIRREHVSDHARDVVLDVVSGEVDRTLRVLLVPRADVVDERTQLGSVEPTGEGLAGKRCGGLVIGELHIVIEVWREGIGQLEREKLEVITLLQREQHAVRELMRDPKPMTLPEQDDLLGPSDRHQPREVIEIVEGRRDVVGRKWGDLEGAVRQ